MNAAVNLLANSTMTSLLAEITRASLSENSLNISLFSQIARLESSLTANLGQEISNRVSSVAAVNASLMNEITRALAVEGNLSVKLAQEMMALNTSLLTADASLLSFVIAVNASLLNEITRALAVEGNLSVILAQEISQRSAAVAALNTSLVSEQARAIAAETPLLISSRVVIGSINTSCISNFSGGVRFNNVSNAFEVCNGTLWIT